MPDTPPRHRLGDDAGVADPGSRGGDPDVARALRDAAYTAVGFGVLGFQRAQVRRRELTSQLQTQRPEIESQLAQARGQLADLARDLERRVEPALVDVSERVEPLLDQIEARLPAQARGSWAQFRQAARQTREQLQARLDRGQGAERA